MAVVAIATMAVSASANLSLYRQLLRAARSFTNYNFRDYATRYVRDDFRSGSRLTDPEEVAQAFKRGKLELRSLQRQATVSALYPDRQKHSMESAKHSMEP